MFTVSKKMRVAQSMLEYLALLAIAAAGITLGTIAFGKAVNSGLDTSNDHIARTVQESVDDTHKATVVTYPDR